MPSDRIRLSVAEAREHAKRAMRGIGYDAEECDRKGCSTWFPYRWFTNS